MSVLKLKCFYTWHSHSFSCRHDLFLNQMPNCICTWKQHGQWCTDLCSWSNTEEWKCQHTVYWLTHTYCTVQRSMQDKNKDPQLGEILWLSAENLFLSAMWRGEKGIFFLCMFLLRHAIQMSEEHLSLMTGKKKRCIKNSILYYRIAMLDWTQNQTTKKGFLYHIFHLFSAISVHSNISNATLTTN